MIIYFTGIDGSGKSTIIKELSENICGNKSVVLLWGRYEAKIINRLINIIKKKHVNDPKNYNTMSKQDYYQWRSYKKSIIRHSVIKKFIFTLQYLDYLIQLRNLRNEIKYCADKIILLDRYLLDFIVDQTINYGDISNYIITKHLLKTLKKIDFIFYIDVSPAIAIKRKNDIPSIDYLIERRDVYKHYCSKMKNVIVINNDRPLEETMRNIKSVIGMV